MEGITASGEEFLAQWGRPEIWIYFKEATNEFQAPQNGNLRIPDQRETKTSWLIGFHRYPCCLSGLPDSPRGSVSPSTPPPRAFGFFLPSSSSYLRFCAETWLEFSPFPRAVFLVGPSRGFWTYQARSSCQLCFCKNAKRGGLLGRCQLESG